MKKAKNTVLLLSLLTVIGAIFFIGFLNNPWNISTLDERNISIDCRNQEMTCNSSEIEKRVTYCEPWHPWSPKSDLNCSYTPEEIGNVSIITDPANYVTAPKTEAKYDTHFVAQTGNAPWDLEFLPSGNPTWTNSNGKIRYLDNDTVKTLTETDIEEDSKTGLLGLALHPKYSNNKFVYLFYSYNKTDGETLYQNQNLVMHRVSRFRLQNGELTNQTTLLEIPGAGYHVGGRLEFGPDGKLYITTGDSDMLYYASNRSFLEGKILRINSDGSIPEDNPFNGSPVYSTGHRNPQGLAWQPETSNLYNTEHGPWRHDEINRILPGESYGWSGYKCNEKTGLFGQYQNEFKGNPAEYYENTPPAYCFKDWTMSPSGATFVNDTQNPWHGDLFIAGLRGNQIFRLKFRDGKPTEGEVFYVSNNQDKISLRLRDVEYHNNSLYAIGDKRGMIRISQKN